MTGIGSTWSGTYEFTAGRLHEPRTLEELQRIVAAAPRIRALGTRHSFNDVADSAEVVSLVDLDPAFELDPAAMTVSVAGGTRFGVLANWLNAQGYALHNMGSLPHISIAGAVSTGTHGSGNSNGNLATAVTALQLVTASGDLVEVGRSHPSFAGMVVALGTLGVATRVTLDIQPTYQVRQDVYHNLSWEAVLADFEGLTGSAYSVSLFADWAGDRVAQAWLKTRLDGDGEPTSMPDRFFDGFRVDHDPTLTPEDEAKLTPRGGVPGPWSARLPHFRLESTPSNGDEIQSEFFIDRGDAVAALGVIRSMAADITPHLLITELRTTAPDGLWMSPAYGRPSLGIHFTWKNEPEAVYGVLPSIEAALAPFGARPHWGKAFTSTAESIVPLYERASDFAALVAEHDPHGKFRNGYLARVLGL